VGGGQHPEARLSELPAVHEIAARLKAPHPLAVSAARQAIAEARQARLDRLGSDLSGEGVSAEGVSAESVSAESVSADAIAARAAQLLGELEQPSLRRVINATGIVLHTNLGRAPLPTAAQTALADVARYSNLEIELASGERGSRHAHVEGLLCELTGAEAAMVVNNGAAAVLLAVAALAGGERAVVVSRGQLVEIGGGFRIPEVIASTGARLVEVGTTNRTRVADYERALERFEDGVILRVHQSNFRTVGFVEDVPIERLCALGRPVIDDVGSGLLDVFPSVPALAEEPAVRRSVLAGATLVCCSGDKLLGGPQAGLLVGTSDAVAGARRHPLARALRIDKLSLAALAATLGLHCDPQRALEEIPALAMLAESENELYRRAERICQGIGGGAEIVRSTALAGGGSLPLVELAGPVVAVMGTSGPDALAAALRQHRPPVLSRVREGCLILDPRTLSEDEIDQVVAAVRAVLHSS
jgi:L-seryl-tRNA(Ser) seleniumtransferase